MKITHEISTYARTEYGGFDQFHAVLGQEPNRRRPLGVRAEDRIRRIQSCIFDRTALPVHEAYRPYALAGITASVVNILAQALLDPEDLNNPVGPSTLVLLSTAGGCLYAWKYLRERYSLKPLNTSRVEKVLSENMLRQDQYRVIESLNQLVPYLLDEKYPDPTAVFECVHTYISKLSDRDVPSSAHSAKQSLYPRGMCSAGNGGIHSNLTGEVVVLDPNNVVTVAHEFAHAHGIRDELQTECTALLALISSHDPTLRIHGYLGWLEHILNARLIIPANSESLQLDDIFNAQNTELLELGLNDRIINLRKSIVKSISEAISQPPKGLAQSAMWAVQTKLNEAVEQIRNKTQNTKYDHTTAIYNQAALIARKVLPVMHLYRQ